MLKKSTLNPNSPESYRPVTLSSVNSKLLEAMLMPADEVDDTQFGFRSGRSTGLACTLLNDTLAYARAKDTPIYMCSLDAEKCFDKIWHAGLMFKL